MVKGRSFRLIALPWLPFEWFDRVLNITPIFVFRPILRERIRFRVVIDIWSAATPNALFLSLRPLVEDLRIVKLFLIVLFVKINGRSRQQHIRLPHFGKYIILYKIL